MRLIVSLILSIAVCAFTWLHYGVQFSGMDDYSLMAFMSGEYTGQIEPFLYVQNVIYTFGVSLLYRLDKTVPWFTIVFMIGIFLSVFALTKSVVKNAKTLLSLICNCIMAGVIYCGLVMYSASLMQFTSVSAVCGMGAIALMLSMVDGDAKWERILDVVLVIILTFMGLTIRKDTGYFVFAVIIATCIYKFLEKKVNVKIIVGIIVGTSLFFLASLCLQKAYLSQDDWAKYKTYNDARSGILDYPAIAYENDPEFFDAIGWDEELVNLAEGNWYSIDEEIEVSDMEAIRNRSGEYFADNGLSLLEQIIKVTDIGFTYRYFGFWGLVLLATVVGTLVSGQRNIGVLGTVAYYIGAVSLVMFLGILGRMTFALMNSIFILAMPPSIILVSELISKDKFNIFFKVVVGFFVVILSYKMLLTGRGLCQKINHYDSEIALKCEIDAYTLKHKDNLYIYDTNLPMMGTPFDTPTGREKYNLIFWGGTFYESPMYHRQLALCGYDSFTSDNWFDDGVYYMTKDEPNVAFVEYMTKHYLGCEFVLVDEENGFNVYRLKLD